MSAPLLQQTTPADNLPNAAVTANLVLTFDQIVRLGTAGTIRIYKSDGTLVHTISVTDSSQVSLEASARPEKVTINPNINLQSGTGYYVLIDAGVVENRTGEDFAGISSPTAFNFTTAGTPPGGGDTTAPLLTTTTPLDNATGVAVGSNLILTFNESVQAGSGNIEIHNANGTIAKTIAVTDGTQVSFSGNQLTINPTTDLTAGSGYYVTMSSGVVRDLANNNFSGISSPTTFDFTTAAAGPDNSAPLLTGTSPADNAPAVSANTNLVLTFNETVKAGTGNIEIRSTTYPGIPILIPVTDTNRVSFSGNQVTINPTYDFAPGYTYYATFASGVVLDQANNAFAGIASPEQFNFTIAGAIDTTAPQLVSTTPTDETPNVNAHANIVLTFDEVVKPGAGTIWIVGGGGKIIDINDTSQVTFSGNQVIISPTNDLLEGVHYHILMQGGVIRDLAENSFLGFPTEENSDFTTADPTPPTLVSATAQGDNYFYTFIFSEIVQRGSGNVQFRNALDGSLVRSIAITDESQVYFSGGLIQVTPSTPLPLGINYYVTMGSGVVLDGAGNSFAGISSPTTFTFSTLPLDLIGTQGADTLTGTSRNEVLNGLTGVDTLIGGLGDDTYIIDNYEGGATSLLMYAPPPSFGSRHVTVSHLPDADEVTIVTYDHNEDGLIDRLIIGYQNDDFPGDYFSIAFSANEIGQNLTEGVTYADARGTWTPGHAGFDMHSSGSFDTVPGSTYANFTITDLNVDYTDPDNPVVLSFSITFDWRNYNPDWPVKYGTVNYNYPAAGPVSLDTIVESPNAGIDTVQAAMSYTLPANFENLTLTGGINGIGNAADNVISAYGFVVDNVLDGKAGADTMIGSYGDDTYIVDNTGDQAIEDQDSLGGLDKVFSSATFTLGIYVEDLTLTGFANINGTGNSQGNVLTGNLGNNILNGGGGSDWIVGGGGNDTFYVLPGQTAVIADFSAGAGVGDVVVLDGFSFASFSAVQAAMSQNGGNTYLDLGNGHLLNFLNVAKSSFVANDFYFGSAPPPPPPSGPEPFTLPVSGAYTNTITGTRRVDNLTGTAANNRIDGKQGNDTMTGLAGDDTYIVDSTSDNVVEGLSNGIDTVISSASNYTLANNVENLTLTGTNNHTATGNGLDNLIIASSRPDIINGGAGNDIIRAGTGACVLTGSAGNDIFDFDVMGSQKQVTDFTVGQDLVDLRTLLAWYGGSDPLAANAISLSAVAGGVLVSVKASAGGSLLGLVKITGVSVGDLDIGSDILWDT